MLTDNSPEIIAKQNKYDIKPIKDHGAFLQNCTSEAVILTPHVLPWSFIYLTYEPRVTCLAL